MAKKKVKPSTRGLNSDVYNSCMNLILKNEVQSITETVLGDGTIEIEYDEKIKANKPGK